MTSGGRAQLPVDDETIEEFEEALVVENVAAVEELEEALVVENVEAVDEVMLDS